jgi:hypothetical protein
LYHGFGSGCGCDDFRGQRICGHLALVASQVQETKEHDAQLFAREARITGSAGERAVVDQ